MKNFIFGAVTGALIMGFATDSLKIEINVTQVKKDSTTPVDSSKPVVNEEVPQT